eukprot:3996271-Pyramimonas_sp.AAC.1
MGEDAFRMGWFLFLGATRIAVTFHGARPGTPFGDALLLVIIAEFMSGVARELEALGPSPALDAPGANIFEAAVGDWKVAFSGRSHADGSMFAFLAPVDVLRRHLGDFCRIALNSFAPAGLVRRLLVGNAEMMMHLHGPGYAAYRRHFIMHLRRGYLCVCSCVVGLAYILFAGLCILAQYSRAERSSALSLQGCRGARSICTLEQGFQAGC